MYLEKVIEGAEQTFIINNGDYISAVACVVSIVAAILSLTSYLLSRQQYELQLKMYSDGLSNFNFKIIDAYIKDDKEYDKIQYWFNLLITNMSDKQISIIEYVLKLECSDGIIFRPECLAPHIFGNTDVVRLIMPQNIDAHSSTRGWCVFEIPRETFNELDIEECRIVLKDIHDKKESQTAIYIKEELINYEV